MKNLLLTIFLIILLTCKSNEPNPADFKIKTGSYSGTFQYDTINVWESIEFEQDSFFENASGGIACQKYPFICLTKGIYAINHDSISFNHVQVRVPPVWVERCDNDGLLKGTYYIEEVTDSAIIFRKDALKGPQIYNLKLYIE